MDKICCRLCGNSLVFVFADLGLSPLANQYIAHADLDKGQFFYPLKVYVCENCFLVQAMEFSKPEEIFSDYKYFSSFSASWLTHCKQYVNMIIARLRLNKNSNVVEIACNDGYLLQYFSAHGIQPYGVEPAENVACAARKKGLEVVTDFFGEALAMSLAEKRGKADLIIANNVIAHVPDLNDFIRGLRTLLAPNGCITVEFPHVLNLITQNQFDTIYHEHYSYFSLLTLKKAYETHGLAITKVETLPTHGGSLRIYAAHKGADVDGSVQQLLDLEISHGLNKVETYTAFNNNIMEVKRNSLRLLIDLKNKGKKIAAFGAAAKGNTFLNFCGIGRDFVDYVADSNQHKQGLFLPGTLIPIVSKERIIIDKPDYIIILPWNLCDEIKGALADTKAWGCQFITFIPDVWVFV